MNYIGSKTRLLSFLDASIAQIANGSCARFCDAFAGTGAVGSHFKKLGFQVIANDIQTYSFILNQHYIGNSAHLLSKGPQLCEQLSQLEGKEGFLYCHYTAGGSKHDPVQRLYLSDENAKQCDAIRQEIECWKIQNKITMKEYYFLLTCLIEAMDKVANTASVYGAHLKQLKKSAQIPLRLKPAKLIPGPEGHVFQKDINALIHDIDTDILYLDPPYNHRQYSGNYHLLETLALYDTPTLKGKSGLRKDNAYQSPYCLQKKAKKAFSELISKAKAKYIFLSYNNEGILSLADIEAILSTRGQYGRFTQPHTRFKADSNRTQKATQTLEYLHYVII